MQDIHTHLYWKSYDADRDLVVARARVAGIKEMIVIGCTVGESKQAVAVAEQYPDMYAAVGIHPHFFNELVEKEFSITHFQFSNFIAELRELAKNEKVVAIGECGLDYYSYDKTKIITDEQKATQKEGFLAQIVLAQELGLPVIVHCRPSLGTQDSYEDLFQILQDSRFKNQKSILHCYMGDTEVTKQFLTLPNVYFSFTGNITYPVKKVVVGTKDDLAETVKMIPLERLFVETDCPFLAPQSHRGERNEPSFVIEVADKVAELHNSVRVTVEKATEENFEKAFKKERVTMV